MNKKVPKLNTNVEPIVGWVEDTLERLKPYLVKNAIILFDELYNYDGWESREYKALKEILNENEFEYKSFNLLGCQSMIRLK